MFQNIGNSLNNNNNINSDNKKMTATKRKSKRQSVLFVSVLTASAKNIYSSHVHP